MSRSHFPIESQTADPARRSGWSSGLGHWSFRARAGSERGLGVIELMIAVVVILTIMGGVFAAVLFSVRGQRALTYERRAKLIAGEALATARYERDASWDTFAALPVDTPLYPTFSGGNATLSTTDPGAVDGLFTQTVTLSRVFRDGSGNIAPMGATEDTNARGVEVNVSWTDPFGRARTLTVDSYLMDLGS